MRYLIVAIGGAAGAVARYAVTLLVAIFWKRDFPLATLLINVSGSFNERLNSTSLERPWHAV